MPDIPTDVVHIMYQLLPGFLAAGLFYSLTAHPKGNSFERVIQALIFTGVIQSIVFCVKWFVLFVGRDVHWGTHYLVVGSWNYESGIIWSFLVAAVLGVLLSRNVHTQSAVYKWLKRMSCSRRPPSPSQWYSAFHKNPRWMVLHLDGKERLKGWAEEWPDSNEVGHFLMYCPSWLLDDGSEVELPQIHRMLIPSKDVKRVDFLNLTTETTLTEDIIRQRQQSLYDLQKQEQKNGESTAPDTATAVQSDRGEQPATAAAAKSNEPTPSTTTEEVE